MERPALLRPTLSPITAWKIRSAAMDEAKKMGLEKGAVRVGGRHRLIRLRGSFGDAAPAYKELAGKKLKDVLNWRRSGSIGKERREANGQVITDFTGTVQTNVIGGVAIFSYGKDGKKHFLGGAAFSGGTPAQDEAITKLAIQKVGLQTDLPYEPTAELAPFS